VSATKVRRKNRTVSEAEQMLRILARPLALISVAAAVVTLSVNVLAQGQPAPRSPSARAPAPIALPYDPVMVTLAIVAADAQLVALRKELADIVKRKDRAALSQRGVAKQFFWERDFAGAFDANKSSIDNLAAALDLDAEDGSGWEILSRFIEEPSVGPLPGKPDIFCAPAMAQFDQAARDKLIDFTKTDGIEWVHPRSAGLQVHAAAQANAPVIETLRLHFVRLLQFENQKIDSDPIRTAWMRVATPAGKTGFVAPGSLVSPYTDRLCFSKEGAGQWRIAGYVGGGD
jgi:hypothetical protein